jgi:ADP-ribosylglycohydrolase
MSRISKDRIRASLLAMAAGDALGAGVFKLTREEIAKRYPDGLTNFVAPDRDSILAGLQAGEVTDGTSQALLLVDVLENSPTVQVPDTYFEALRNWLKMSEFGKYVGPSTERALKNGSPAPSDNEAGSNGAAMRTAPIGWFFAGDPKSAVDLAIDVAALTHTGTGVVGAAMISAAVSVAVADGSIEEILAAAHGAIDQVDSQTQVPRSAEALRKALNEVEVVAGRVSSYDSLAQRLKAFTYPTSTAATGSVIAALGCAIACIDNPFDAITLAVNCGDDTHTTAMMAGAICGAKTGDSTLPSELFQRLNELNRRLHNIDFDRVVDQVS